MTEKEFCNLLNSIRDDNNLVIKSNGLSSALNEDRHLNNINLIYNSVTNSFSLAPIFDNGLSLLSDTNDYPLSVNTAINIRSVKSKPFSTSFSKQVSYFTSDLLKIDYNGFMLSLKENEAVYKNNAEYSRAKFVLDKMLQLKENILWQRV